MGMGRRAYDLLRAYVGREWERIETVYERSARTELNDFLDHQPTPPAFSKKNEEPEATPSAQDMGMTEAVAMRVLNLHPNSTLADLQREYKRLSERSLPTNFPEGSEERHKAAQVHLKVQEAYDVLLPKFDVRVKRFQTLDLD